jgi:hypothetical protein
MTTKAVIAAIGTKLFLAKIIIAYAVTYSPTTASLAVLPIISNIFFECPDDPR